MYKIKKYFRFFSWIIFIIINYIVILNNNYLTHNYHLPKNLIPIFFVLSFSYICYHFCILIFKEDKVEQEMISIMNHTFRTPLTNIIWHINELEKNISQNEKLIYLQNINNSTNNILNAIDVFIGINNIKSLSNYNFQAISIREIIEKSITRNRDTINKKNINFKFLLSNDIPLLTIDLNKISFVIDTLIDNAITYTKNDGKILIDCIFDSKKIKLFISDTGIGLTLYDKIMIFSKFYRNKKAKLINPNGLGLRLYLSKLILKRHNGQIYAKSNGKNKGSTFFVKLPFSK
jgi:signal transduction histidine kinase